METRQVVLALVVLVTLVIVVRGVVALGAGEFGTVARQGAIGAVVLAFGIGLYRRWETIG
jgi:TRAP-type mannitol/chloroaromatic compound transport system permease large subunit